MTLSTWTGCDLPDMPDVTGRFVHLTQIDLPRDIPGLFANTAAETDDELWRYLPLDRPDTEQAYQDFMAYVATPGGGGWRAMVFYTPDKKDVLGMSSFMRNRAYHGSTEIGCVLFSKRLQRSPAATEAMYLMMRHVFDDLGYRRYEWKCNSLNAASKRAALRLGFTYEGEFRQDMVVKGENRDTAWFSILDSEWPQVKAGFEAWLSPENFDADGGQKQSLAAIREALS